jgi:hypothetical protein
LQPWILPDESGDVLPVSVGVLGFLAKEGVGLRRHLVVSEVWLASRTASTIIFSKQIAINGLGTVNPHRAFAQLTEAAEGCVGKKWHQELLSPR